MEELRGFHSFGLWDAFTTQVEHVSPKDLKGTQLRDVRSITPNLSAFAALRGDGTVATWMFKSNTSSVIIV